MPNGFHGSPEEWERITAPLRPLDPVLSEFAARHGMALERGGRAWPSRSLRWGGSVDRLIQIFLEDEDALTWNLWICASQDRTAGRHWKQRYLRRGVPIDRIEEDLEALLEEARGVAEGWTGADLEPADPPGRRTRDRR